TESSRAALTPQHENLYPRPAGWLTSVCEWYCESVQSLTRELQEPHIVAASTPSRIFAHELLPPHQGGTMELLIARCAGLDVHQATVVATVRVPGDAGDRRIVTETFGTMT